MDTSDHYDMCSLFAQMGLPSEPEQVNQFLREHRLFENQVIAQADFWSPAQAAFIMEATAQDSDWTELVDHLDAALRH
mgnify:CR=1 FL=1